MSRWLVGLSALIAAACGIELARRRGQKRDLLARKRRLEEKLDEALMESFPASDPPAVSHARS